MNRTEAKEKIKAEVSCKTYLQKSKNGNYCCPYCDSGTGRSKTGAVKYYEKDNGWHCHKCGKSGDVIDLVMKRDNCDYNTALSLLAREVGITINETNSEREERIEAGWKYHKARQEDVQTSEALSWDSTIEQDEPGEPDRGAETPAEPQRAANDTDDHEGTEKSATGQIEGMNEDAAETDYTAYYKACRETIEQDPAGFAYMESRGISKETCREYWIGYDPNADPARSGHETKRVIIPVTRGHYIARRIDGNDICRALNPKGATPGIFNQKALKSGARVVFIVEGAIDALSLSEIGVPAVGLNSTANAGKFIKYVEALQKSEVLTPKTVIAICLDSDQAGQKATEEIINGCRRLNVSYIAPDILGGYNDPNEALVKDREALEEMTRAAIEQTSRPDNSNSYIDVKMKDDIERFRQAGKKTGFSELDRITDGIYPGLYTIAAIPSLGKTTFCLQIADQLAAQGHDVIFFSLEQSRFEVVSKSIARYTAMEGGNVSARSIQKGYLPKEALRAVDRYKKEAGGRMNIVEGDFNCNITFIDQYIRAYIERNNVLPVIFIDYLQILQPSDEQLKKGYTVGVRETIDAAVKELKRLSRALDLTIFAICSVNRANYMTPFSMECLKESGNIEYTSDVIWGLQLQCLEENLFSEANKLKEKRERIDEAKRETPRKIMLAARKNRGGVASFDCMFDYFPANERFVESAEEAQDDDNWPGWSDIIGG